MITHDRFSLPPYIAHITIIKSEEMLKEQIEEIDEEIFFEIIECTTVYPRFSVGVEAAYVITVESPQLDAIRKKYGLEKPRHPFNIIINRRLFAHERG